jgi:hypothetical protein
MKTNKLIMTLVAFTVVNFVVVQEWRINDMKNQLELSDMRAKVNAEFADELLWLQVNDVEKVATDALIAQGRIEGMVSYFGQDVEDRQHIDNLWHEGYMRGLSQVDWEYDTISETHYNKGYKEALDKAFPDGDYPQYVNYPPREVNEDAIKTPEFDDSLNGLKDNTEVIDQLNDKIKQVKDEG